MSNQDAKRSFIEQPIYPLFLKNALPMVILMTLNGMMNIIDAAFLGRFVGADALAAVSIIFPVLVVIIAVSTLISSGMSSVFARRLGAGDLDSAKDYFANAHGLALCVALVFISLFALLGNGLTHHLAGGENNLAEMAYDYLSISIYSMPIQLFLSIHANSWRNEGKAGAMALVSVIVTMLNIGMNYLLIVVFEYGVVGSAFGTLLAELTGLALLVIGRLMNPSMLPIDMLFERRWLGHWRSILMLGAPLSLSFIGIALASTVVIGVLHNSSQNYLDVAAAYGITTRVLGFIMLPLMAIAFASQSLVGHNFGAARFDRSNAILRLAIVVALIYCIFVQGAVLLFSDKIGLMFTQNLDVINEVDTIFNKIVLMYWVTGPVLILSMYFQSIGQPVKSAILSLIKPYILAPLFILFIASTGEIQDIWYATPFADSVICFIALVIAMRCKRIGLSSGFGVTA